MNKFFSKLRFLSAKPAVFIYFFILSCVWTYPIIFRLNNRVLGFHDAFQNIWNLWWVKTALIDLHTSPFYTNYIHWPKGVSLLFHTLTLTNSVIAIPLQYFLDLISTYNLLMVLNIAFAGFGTYLLANYLTKNKFAAFMAGYIVAFSPYLFSRTLGHLNLISFGWVPLFIYFYLKMLKGQTRWFVPAIFLGLVAFTDLYYFYFTCLFLIIHWIYLTIFERKTLKENYVRLGLMVLASAILLSPYIGTLVYQKLTNADFNFGGHNPMLYSLDTLALVTPGLTSHFKEHFVNFWQTWSWESQGYLGFSVLFLVIFGLIKIRSREVFFWLVIFLIFIIFSLGPYLQIKGVTFKNIPLPYFLAEKYIPFLSFQGVASRFMSFAYLALAILAAYSLAYILRKITLIKIIIVIVLISAIGVEYWPTSPVLSQIPISNFYDTLSKDKNDYAILDLSFEESRVLYYQTIHHKRIIGGYISRVPVSNSEFLLTTPTVSDIYQGRGFVENLDVKGAVEDLKKYRIKYVLISVYDKNRLNMMTKLNLPVVYQASKMVVYQVY